jgi:hypothetical protein
LGTFPRNPMKHRSLLGLALALLATVVPSLAQNTTQEERIAASTMIAFGRPALAAELADPRHANKALPELLKTHTENLKSDPALQRQIDARAFVDVFGSDPLSSSALGAKSETSTGGTYAGQLRRHLATLAANPDEYRRVINRAYRLVIRRDAYPEEYEYWQARGTLPYVVLVGAIENWAFRNQPGLMVTTGTPSIAVPSRFLRTQRVSLAVANEAREILGLPVWTDVARQHSPGRNIVAVGAKDIESVGGVHFLLAGGGPLAEE